jgi:hypothetical protein
VIDTRRLGHFNVQIVGREVREAAPIKKKKKKKKKGVLCLLNVGSKEHGCLLIRVERSGSVPGCLPVEEWHVI